MLRRARWAWLRTLFLICLSVIFSLGLTLLQPGFAQTVSSPSPKANVVIDGQVLFRLGSIDGFSAEQRAEFVNDSLQQALQTNPERPIQIRLLQREELTTLRVKNRHLLTVTEGDFMRGVTSQEQAEAWAEILEAGLKKAQWERQPEYYRSILWRALSGFMLAIAFYGAIHWKRRQLRRQLRPSKTVSYGRRILQPALLCLQLFGWFAFLLYLCELFPQARIGRYRIFQFLQRVFSNSLLTVGERGYSLLDIFKLIALSLLLWVGVRGLTAVVKSRFLQAAIPDRGVQDAIATLMQVSLMGLGGVILLQAWGIDLRALAVAASVLGVGLGFGLQNIVNNFISGWILLLERPVQVGDFINLGDLMGTVERIGARSTEIRTLDRVSIIVPNADLVESRVVNWSHGHPVSRLHIPLGTAYGSPIERVHTAVLEAAQAHPEVLRYPKPQLRFLGFGDSSLDFDLIVWIRDPRHQFDIKSDLYYLLEANLNRYQIEIPFPQRDLNLRTPELQSLIQDWSNTLKASDASPLPNSTAMDEPEPKQRISPSFNLLDAVLPYSGLLQAQSRISEDDVATLVEQMRGADGLSISERRFRLAVYPHSFVGSEAVEWIMKTQKATRESAIKLGQRLVELGILHHVSDEHPFKDEYLFYRFYEDEK